MSQGSVHFTKEQIVFLLKVTGASTPNEAVEILVSIMQAERIDPTQMPIYIKKLMERQGPAK